jgi:XTP/dITP diphosphohydrolase
LQERLKNVEQEKRTCHYGSVLVSVDPKSEKTWTYEHKLPGRISEDYHGELGFGYDAIFICEDGRHYALYSDSERDAISHRGLGVKEFLKYLKNA